MIHIRFIMYVLVGGFFFGTLFAKLHNYWYESYPSVYEIDILDIEERRKEIRKIAKPLDYYFVSLLAENSPYQSNLLGCIKPFDYLLHMENLREKLMNELKELKNALITDYKCYDVLTKIIDESIYNEELESLKIGMRKILLPSRKFINMQINQ